MCMLTCSIPCCWFRVKSGHFLLGSGPLGLVMPSSLCTQGRDGGKEQKCCWKGQGRGSSEDPFSHLCHTSGIPGVLGCHTPEAA